MVVIVIISHTHLIRWGSLIHRVLVLARKRKVVKIDGVKNSANANLLVLKYVKNYKYCEFGPLFKHVNSELGVKLQYTRKGFALRLKNLIDEGEIGCHPYRQNHCQYYLTKKGKKNIELISNIFADFSYKLLDSHFQKKQTRITKEHYVQRIIERIGTYMLFSYTYGFSKYAIPEKNSQDNHANMKEWGKGINPGFKLEKYLTKITRNFIEFDNEEDMSYTDSMDKKSFYNIMEDFRKILQKKFPEEFEMLDSSVKYLDFEINIKKFNKMTKTQQINSVKERMRKKIE
jgi:hypothetical protein